MFRMMSGVPGWQCDMRWLRHLVLSLPRLLHERSLYFMQPSQPQFIFLTGPAVDRLRRLALNKRSTRSEVW